MSRLETAIEALRLGSWTVHGAWLTRDSNVLKMLAPEYFGSLPLSAQRYFGFAAGSKRRLSIWKAQALPSV